MAKKKRKFETPRTLHDWPLTNDQEALFSFDDFAATLARLIADKETKTPLTIGISGRWGSGKTTLLRRIERMLVQTNALYDSTKPAGLDFCNDEENPQARFRPCRTVWFNAWKYADEEQLLVALIRVIVQEMAKDDIVSKVLVKLLDPSYPRRDVVNTVLSWFSIKVGDVNVSLNTGETKETPFAQKTAMLDLFDEAFNRLMAAWVHRSLDATKVEPKKGVLVVFIDDLDRCLPPKMVQVLEAIKLFMDKRGCIFVLGADTEIVRRAVEKQYTDAGVTGQGAGDYLEKIVQLRFELPPATYETMQEFLDGEEIIGEDWGDSWRLLITGAEINPRKVKTFVNDLNLQWAMLVNSGQAQGVNRADFNAWQVLARIAPRNFLDQIRERLEDLDLRYKFVMDAIKWSRGEESLNATFQQYDSWRLKRVLRDLAFGGSFNEQVLDAFVHLTAPPQMEEEVKSEPVAEGLEQVLEIQEEPKMPEMTAMQIAWQEALDRANARDKRRKSQRVKAETAEVGVHNLSEIFTFTEIPFMKIPAGKFLIGSKDDNELAWDNERPQHTVALPEFYIARFPVTNEQYLKFTDATGYITLAENEGGENPEKEGFEKGFNWRTPLGQNNVGQRPKHPVVQITWQDALEYINWLNEGAISELPPGYKFILPSEAQWEKAARGEYGNEWPWGNLFDKNRCNSRESERGDTVPVDAYPAGVSPYGVMDMVGNVWEWTQSLYKEYPYKPDNGRDVDEDVSRRVLRGGSFTRNARFTRCASRANNAPDTRGYALGFRVCVSPAEK